LVCERRELRMLQLPDWHGIEALNTECFCLSLDEQALQRTLAVELGDPGMVALVKERCPYLFSAHPVFITQEHLANMAGIIRAVAAVVALPSWHERVLAAAPAIARHPAQGARGAFFGYDFHLNERELGLIEINTNAGGAMLNAVLAQAQVACCEEIAGHLPSVASVAELELAFVAMFRQEWNQAGSARPLQSIAIVDEAPRQQYLYPEFLLFSRLFQRHGIQTVIAEPGQCELRQGKLWIGELQIDLVYNRLTDFMLEQPDAAILRQAFLTDAVVLTPHPQAHALYADKRNLVLLSDPGELAVLGVPQALQDVLLAGIPRTELVDAADADRLWAARKRLFFKPAAGYGSRAAYRGDKLTSRVWQDILKGDYVAQALVTPGERNVAEGEQHKLKFDVRNYVYDGAVQWVAARLYQGQTTNFRTPGGGFAPVYSYPACGLRIGESGA